MEQVLRAGLQQERCRAARGLLAHDRFVHVPARLSDRSPDRLSDRRTDEESRQHRPGVRANGEDGPRHARSLDGKRNRSTSGCRSVAGRDGSGAEAGERATVIKPPSTGPGCSNFGELERRHSETLQHLSSRAQRRTCFSLRPSRLFFAIFAVKSFSPTRVEISNSVLSALLCALCGLRLALSAPLCPQRFAFPETQLFPPTTIKFDASANTPLPARRRDIRSSTATPASHAARERTILAPSSRPSLDARND